MPQASTSDIGKRLHGHIEEIARQLIGKPTTICGTELRFRTHGSLSVETDKQCYFDFEADRGGGAFDLILLLHKDDQTAAMVWAEHFLSGNPPKPPPRQRAKSQTDEGMAAYALSLIGRSQLSASTVVEAYLEDRGITDPKLIKTVGHVANARFGEDAMIVASTDGAGNPVAIQLTFLSEKGEKSTQQPQRKTFKIDPKWSEKGVVRFPGTGTPIVCEGVENAMACAQATGQPAFAVLGVSNFGKYLPSGVESLVLSPDGDDPNAGSHKAVRDAIDQYRLAGIDDLRVVAIKFDAENQRKIDANNILLEQGADTLKAILEAAEPANLSYRGEVQRLAAMDPDDCAPLAKPVHKAMKERGIDVPLKDFRDAIKRKRAEGENSDCRREMLASTASPSDHLRSGDELLTNIIAVVRSLVVLEEHQALLAALYVLFSHVFDAFDICPRLFITAPTRATGKTRLASILGAMVARPVSATSASVAAMFRLIEAEAPTLVIGEVDSFMRQSEDHRNLVNGGHLRDEAFVLRTIGDDHRPARFSTFAPMILSGIGRLHHTSMSRSIVIRMQRKTKDEVIQRLDRNQRKSLKELQSQIARWAIAVRPKLENYEPPKPIETLDDRPNDNAEPFLVIARLVGPAWETKARQAFLAIALRPEEMADEDLKLLALSDLRDCFLHHEQNFAGGVLFTKQVLAYLYGRHDRPWAEIGKSERPISEAKLGRLLRDLVPTSEKVSHGNTRLRGYRWDSCADGFNRYLRPLHSEPDQSDAINCTNGPDKTDPPTLEFNLAPEVGAPNAAENCASGHLDTSTPPATDVP